MFTYNTHIHKATQFTPFELLFGKKAYIPNSLTSPPQFRYTYDDYHAHLKLKLNKSFELAKQNLVHSKEQSKSYYDTSINKYEYNVGDQVLIRNKENKPGLTKKLTFIMKGPYEIVKGNRNKTNQVQTSNCKIQTYHHNLLVPYFSPESDY